MNTHTSNTPKYTNAHIHTYSCTHTYIHTYTHTHNTCTHTYILTHIHIHTCTHMHMHTHMHTQAHTSTHTYTHTHTHMHYKFWREKREGNFNIENGPLFLGYFVHKKKVLPKRHTTISSYYTTHKLAK